MSRQIYGLPEQDLQFLKRQAQRHKVLNVSKDDIAFKDSAGRWRAGKFNPAVRGGRFMNVKRAKQQRGSGGHMQSVLNMAINVYQQKNVSKAEAIDIANEIFIDYFVESQKVTMSTSDAMRKAMSKHNVRES